MKSKQFRLILAFLLFFVLQLFCIGRANSSPVTADFVGENSRLFIKDNASGLYQYNRTTKEITSSLLAIYDVDESNFTYISGLREITFDDKNNMYIASYENSTSGIIKIGQNGNVMLDFVQKEPSEKYWGITYGNDNLLYVTESNSNKLRIFNLDGVLLSEYSDNRLNSPRGLAFDTKGNLIVCNSGAHSFLVYDSSFNFITEVVVSTLHEPSGVSVNPNGLIYI